MRKIITYCIFFIISFGANSQAIIPNDQICRAPYHTVTCDRSIVIVNDALYQNSINSFFVNIEASTAVGLTPFYTQPALLSNPTYFDYLGTVNINSNVLHGYRLKPLSFSIATGVEIWIKITSASTLSTGEDIWYWQSLVRDYCGDCPNCFSRIQLTSFYNKLSTQGVSEHGVLYDIFSNAIPFSNLIPSDKIEVVKLLNWYLNLPVPPQVSDWEAVLDLNNLNNTISSNAFCSYEIDQCACFSEILNYYNNIINWLEINWDCNLLQQELEQHFMATCNCSSYFCVEGSCYSEAGVDFIIIKLMPIWQADFPAVIIALADNGTTITSSIAYSTEFNHVCLGGTTLHCISNNQIDYLSLQHEFSWDNSEFAPFNELLVNCNFPCEDCLPSFSPLPGDNYIITTWVKEDGAAIDKTSYTYPSVSIDFDLDPPTPPIQTVGPFTPSGPIIDGWQKIESVFTVPSTAVKFHLKLSSTGGDSYFDDIRIFPAKGSLKTFVYDPVNLRLVAVLDEQHYTTFYEYDEEGKLIRVKKETERGIMTINEHRSSIIKNGQ